jgi:hypothetical protein
MHVENNGARQNGKSGGDTETESAAGGRGKRSLDEQQTADPLAQLKADGILHKSLTSCFELFVCFFFPPSPPWEQPCFRVKVSDVVSSVYMAEASVRVSDSETAADLRS